VKERGQDQWLHDYLDGRLSAEERARAEERIREDADLTRRVEAWRKIGHALRDDSAELPPGFYTRARARFEQSRERRPRFVHRLFSWEAAGLAAVAVLAVGVFVPEMMRSPDPVPRERVVDLREGELRREEAETDADAFAPAPAGKAASAGAELSEPESDRPAGRDFAPEPAKSRLITTEPDVRAGEKKQPLPAPAMAPGDAEQTLAGNASAFRASATGEASLHVVALPRSAAVPEGLRVVDDRSTWNAWLAGPAGPVLRQLESYEAGRRLVLLGGDIDCSTVRVSRVQDEVRVAFVDRGGATAGCAFVLSDTDGSTVVLEPEIVR
jgi:hypothetical protein